MLKYLSVLHRRIASKHNRPLSPASTNRHFQQRGTDVLTLDLYANPWRTGGLKCDIGIQAGIGRPIPSPGTLNGNSHEGQKKKAMREEPLPSENKAFYVYASSNPGQELRLPAWWNFQLHRTRPLAAPSPRIQKPKLPLGTILKMR